MLKRSLLAVAAFWMFPEAISQATNASCLPFYQWTSNSQKQSPCEVASTLLGVCSGGLYTVAALPGGSHYLGPTSLAVANPCQCNTVVYSLMSACGACQGRTYVPWSTWSANCATVSINSYPEPIPPKTFIPGWAYLDVKAQDIFNETLARESANRTIESTAIPSATHTISTSTSTIIHSSTHSSTTTSSVATTTAPTKNDTTPSSSDKHANAVVGGIVGASLGFILIFSFAYWYYSRRRSIAELGVPLPSPTEQSLAAEESGDMRQYLANTLPIQVAPSSINTSSLASPPSVVFTNSSVPGSIGSLPVGRSHT